MPRTSRLTIGRHLCYSLCHDRETEKEHGAMVGCRKDRGMGRCCVIERNQDLSPAL